MKSLILALSLLFATSLLAQTVQNPSFETYMQSGTGAGCGYNIGPVPNWIGSGPSGSFGQAQCGSTVINSTPDGQTIAWITGAYTLTQDLGSVTGNTYNFTVYVAGPRLDGQYTGATATVSLLAGTTSLCSKIVVSSSIPAGTWAAQNLTCTVPAGDLTVSLGCTGGQCLFDNVILTPAQGHQATLTWTDAVNPSGTNYNVYRSTGLSCSNFTKLNSGPISPKTYVDTTITSGQSYCYEVRAISGSTESIAGDALFVMVQ